MTALIEELKIQDETRRKQLAVAARRYFDLLSRADQPEPGASEAIRACLEALERPRVLVAADVESVRRVQAREAAQNRLRGAGERLKAERRAFEELRRAGRPTAGAASEPLYAAERELEDIKDVIEAGRRDHLAWAGAFSGAPLPERWV